MTTLRSIRSLGTAMVLAVIMVAGLAPWARAAKEPAAPDVEQTRLGERIERLPNGLRVIVRERHLGGVAAFRIYVSAGSLNEGEYSGAGISHLLEHVVSGGATPTRTEDQIRDALEIIGAQTNAHTTKQFVCYFGETSAANVGRLIEVIGDYVSNNLIEKKAFDREFEVVQREIERSDADPESRLWQLTDETFFLRHPARYPVLGHLEDLKQLKHEDLAKFYHRVVVPDNAVAVAVGDFDCDQVAEKIRQVLGNWKRRPAAPTVLPERERQVAPRTASAEMDVTSVRMLIQFPTVDLTHPDLYPLDILAFILGEGRASRLVADLRDKRNLVQSIACESITPAGYDGGSFAVLFESDPDKAEAARQAVMEHLARVVKEKVASDELTRAKRQKVSEFVFSLENCEEIATDLGTNQLLLGAPHFSERYVRAIQAVTAEDVQRVAAQYLRPETLCMTTIRPKAKAPAGQAPGVEKPLIAPVPAAKVRPQIIERILPNGVRLLLCPVEGYPTVSIQMFTRGGLSVESEPCAGISSFMAEMMLKGTAKRKAPEIASALDAMGADMAAAAGRNTVYLSAKCLAEDYEKTFDLAADCFLHPTFPQDEMERMRTQILAGLAHMADTPQGEAGLYFNRVFFKDSPYQFPVLGTPDSVKAMTRQNLDAWHKKYVVGNNLVVAVFGGIDLRKAAYYAANAVETVPANTGLVFPKDVPPRTVPAREVYLKPSEKEAALVFVAYPGMDIYNVRDRFAMDILNTIMAGYQMPSGWLFEELRGKGLVYDVHAFSMVGLRPGYYAAEGECRPDKVAEVVRIIEADMARATKEEFTEKQLASARETVITAKELGRETLDGWAFEAAADECLGLGYNFAAEEIWRLRQVRPEDVIRVAREYLKTPVICVLTSDPKAAEAIKKQP